MSHLRRARVVHALVVVAAVLVSSRPARGQANVPQFRGDFGIASGTLPPAGAYVGFLYNSYQADRVVGVGGESIGRLTPGTDASGLVGQYSSPSPIFGAHWAATVMVPWLDAALESPISEHTTGWGLSDVYVQPVKLGWTYPTADMVTGFGVYMPSGRFHPGARDNTGFGMWSYELSAGSTVYLMSRQASLSALASYQINSRVRGTDKRAGHLLTLEGGAGHTVLKDVGQIGLVYYAQWKVTMDENFHLPPPLDGKDRMFGLGPEITAPVPLKPLVGLVTLRYYLEMGNRVATQGDSFFIFLTISKPAKKS